MEIVLFAAVDFPAGPATTSRVKNLARILIAGGNKVTVAILQANTKSPISENTSTTGEVESIRYTYLSGNVVRPSGLSGALVDTAKGCLCAFSFLWKRHREKRVDLVLLYTPDFFQTLPTVALAKLLKIPIILELCEVTSSLLAASYKQRFRSVGAALTDRVLPRLSSGVIVISTRIKELLLSRGIQATRIFHLPVLVNYRHFMEHANASIPSLLGKKYFLNSGALGEKDGNNYLIGAFALLCRKSDDVYLAFTGDPDSSRKRDIMNSAKNLGIAQRIIFTGLLSDNELAWSYQNALALLCCRNGSRYASFGSPTKLSEYLSTGRPVITNAVGDSTLYLVKNVSAFFAGVENCESIAEQMELILADPALAAKVGVEGQKVAQKFFHYENYISPLDAFVRSSCMDVRGAASATRV